MEDIISSQNYSLLKKIKNPQDVCYLYGEIDLLWYCSRILKLEIKDFQRERIQNLDIIYKKCGGIKKDFEIVESVKKMLLNGTFDPKYTKRFFHEEEEFKNFYEKIPKENEIFVRYVIDPFLFIDKRDIVCFSDTHGKHRNLKIPNSSILIFAGDCSNNNRETTIDFLEWFISLENKYKIFVPGNHDGYIQEFWNNPEILKNDYPDIYNSITNKKIIFLIGKSVNINGLNIYGHPVVPLRSNKKSNAFSIPRNKMMKYVKIPKDTDILVTHFPPWGIGDYNTPLTRDLSDDSGDLFLRNQVENLNLKYHIYGHHHNGTGFYKFDGKNVTNSTVFVNTSGRVFEL